MAPGADMVGRGDVSPGTWYLLPTPFGASGELDLASLRSLVEAALSWGVDGLTVMGVMSEPATLTEAERQAALTAIFEVTAGKVPVVVGCSTGSLGATLRLVGEARQFGAVAAMVAAPTLLRNLDLLPDYFSALRRDGDLPLLIQDEPVATGVTVPVSVLARSAAACGARAVKVEDPPTALKMTRLLAADGNLMLFGGLGGVSALSELRHGAAGTMTGFAFPEVMRALREAAVAGRWADASALFDRFLPLILFEAQPQIGLAIRKEVLRRRGVIRAATTRGFVRQLDGGMSEELDDVLRRVRVRPSSALLPLPPLVGPAGR